jgi:hypothetical protein
LDDGKKKSKGAVKGEMRVGVVIFAPPLLRSKPRAGPFGDANSPNTSVDDAADDTEPEQRLVIVKPEDLASGGDGASDGGEFFFKSSWLERSVADERMYKPGDRVQLRMGYVLDTTEQTNLAAKCLGAPSEYSYGIVRSVGRICEGVQRNVEVVAINDLSDRPLVSLYPSYFLAPACKETTLASARDMEVLTDLIKKTASRCSLTLDIDEVIKSAKLQAWANVWSSCAPVMGVDEFLAAHDEWAQWQREKDWDIAQEETKLAELAERESEAESADHAKLCDDNSCIAPKHLYLSTPPCTDLPLVDLQEMRVCSKCGWIQSLHCLSSSGPQMEVLWLLSAQRFWRDCV